MLGPLYAIGLNRRKLDGWFKDLYDEFRMRRSFGRVSEEKTEKEVDFIYEVLNLYKGAKVLDLFCAQEGIPSNLLREDVNL